VHLASKVVFLLVLALIASLAYFALFGFFSVYDDGGYNVAMVRLVAEGVPLYTGQFAYHGPVPYLTKALLLTALGIPITHQSIRFWVLVVWLLSSLLVTAAIWNLVGSWMAAVGALLIVGYHLFALRFSPGHPEDFIVVFLSLAIFVVSSERFNRSRHLMIAMVGVIGAILVGTKINVGLLYLLGASLWMLARLPKVGIALRALCIVGATAIPSVLMHGSLLPEWQLLLLSTLSILLTCTAVLLFPIEPRFEMKHVVVFAVSVILGIAGIALAAMARGSHLKDQVEALILIASKHADVFVRPISFGLFTIPILAVFISLCVGQFVSMTRTRWASPPVASTLKIILALCALLPTAIRLVEYYMPLIGPVCWLIVFPGPPTQLKESARTARLFIASIAIFQMLEVFPITGSQTAWSTLLLCVCCLILLHDGLVELSRRAAGVGKPVVLSVKLVTGLMFAAPLAMTMHLWNDYSRSPSLGFHGSNLVRIPLAVRAKFDWVVASTSRYCDVVVTQPGLNSFLLWSESERETMRKSPVLITGWPLILTSEQERAITAKLSHAPSICAVYSKRLSDWWTNDSRRLTNFNLAQQPLVSYIRDLHHVQEVGDYEIRVNDASLDKWVDDYVLNGVRDINGTRDAVGIPADLLSRADAEVTFGFQARSAGPLISVQQRGTQSEEDLTATEPLTYIARDGVLMIRKTPGTYSRSLSGSVLDGLWHEIILQREQQGWQISLDGRSIGQTAEFLADPDQPKYLQLGPTWVESSSSLGQGWVSFFGKLRDVRVSRVPIPTNKLSATR
jgi:hypothetical protein